MLHLHENMNEVIKGERAKVCRAVVIATEIIFHTVFCVFIKSGFLLSFCFGENNNYM